MRLLLKKLSALVLVLIPAIAIPCTTFNIPQSTERIIGKSYDWHMGHGMILVNMRNMKKTALPMKPGDRPAKWTSKYGSVTFNQQGREMPLGGMNEAGLTIEIMWLDSSKYPRIDSRPTINELQWIQYQFDNFAKTQEVVENAPSLRLSRVAADVHYLVCDVTASCATFEYINRKLVIHSDNQLVTNTLTNHTYRQSVEYLLKHIGFGGSLALPQSSHSLHRFVRAASMSKNFDPTNNIAADDYGFEILDSVRASGTKWNIVYDLKNKTIKYRTWLESEIKNVSMPDFDYSCLKKVKILDINEDLTGNVNEKFINYSYEANLENVRKGLQGMGLPAGSAEKIAGYPSTLTCLE